MEMQFAHARLSGMSEKQGPVSLLHLPDELLLQVIDELDRRSLYTLSVQCKRLQRLTLPLYLLRLGIATPLAFPIDHLIISQSQFYAPGVPMAFFAKQVRTFSFHIGVASSRERTTLALRRLCRMVVNMEGPEELALNFTFRHRYFKPQDLVTEACIHLLDIVAERCTRLTLYRPYGEPLESHFVEMVEKETRQWRSRPVLKGPFKALRKRLSLGISRLPSPHIPETGPHRSSALKTLIFKSNTFLLPPFSDWALRTLNTVPITRLELIGVELSSDLSRLIFGALTIPSLQHLRIIHCLFRVDPLPEFLSRHNSITTFDIESWSVLTLPQTTLPALVSLKSHPKNIGHLLTSTGSFPKLAHVRVVIDICFLQPFDFTIVESALAQAVKRLTETKIRLCLYVFSSVYVDRLVDLWTLPNDLRSYPVLSHVREIAFNVPGKITGATTTTIPAWLSVFPLLEHIELLDKPFFFDHEAKMALLRCIAQKCAGIRTVKIGDDTPDNTRLITPLPLHQMAKLIRLAAGCQGNEFPYYSPSPRSPIMETQFVNGGLSGMPEKQEPVSLLHLPDELLLQVIDKLRQRDLYALSTQCKRLQRLSLPPYLLNIGVTTPLVFPMDHLIIPREPFYAPGIPLAFFAKNVRQFSCDISFVRSPPRTTSALQRLCRMITNMEGLEDLALHFDFENRYFKALTRRDFVIEACIHLLEAVVECCTRLTLSHTYGQRLVSQCAELVEKEASQWRGHPVLKGPLEVLRRRWSVGVPRLRSPNGPEAYPHRSYALKTLVFKSNMFLVPPFSGWAFKTLNMIPITRLDFVNVVLSSSISALMFRALTIPTLQHLRIDACQFEFDAVAEFLSRHNTITTLDINSWGMFKLPKTTLPALVSLKSHPRNIGHLLSPTGVFPKLSHVRVIIHLSSLDLFMFDIVEMSLAQAAKRLMGANIRLCLDVVPISYADDFVQLESVPNDLKEYTVLSHVREIAFGLPRRIVVATTAIPTWLSVFPLLEHIEFLDMPVVLDRDDKMVLLRRIAERCAGIRTVKIEDDTRKISAWLSDS